MVLLWIALGAGLALALSLLTFLSRDGRDVYWRLSRLLLLPPTVIGVMYLCRSLATVS